MRILGLMAVGWVLVGCRAPMEAELRAVVTPRASGYQLELRRGEVGPPEVMVRADVFTYEKRITVEAAGKSLILGYNLALQPFPDGLEPGYAGTLAVDGGQPLPFRLPARATLDVQGTVLDAGTPGVLTIRRSAGLPYVVRIAQSAPYLPSAEGDGATASVTDSAAGNVLASTAPQDLRRLDSLVASCVFRSP